jgi:hypothetical protein
LSGPSAGDIFTTATRRAPARARATLRTRLEGRRPEIEQTLLARVYGIADPGEVDDLAYLEGLRSATSAAVDYGFATIESSQERPPPIPPALLAQARLAARSGVGLDTVLRRYTAGHALLVDFVAEEVERDVALSAADLRRLLANVSVSADRLLAAVSEEHARELASRAGFSRERRRTEQVERLLAGEPVDVGDLAYVLDAEHLGMVACGPEVETALRGIAAALDRHLLLVAGDEGTVWAWLGGRRRPDRHALESLLEDWPEESFLALGEPAKDISGWRLTNRQARAAFAVARRSRDRVARYTDVALLTSILQDDLLATSLSQMCLAPLEEERDGGETLRQTLRAYFAAERNATSAAAALGVSRQTINNRLRAVEERIGCSLDGRLALFEGALQLQELADSH